MAGSSRRIALIAGTSAVALVSLALAPARAIGAEPAWYQPAVDFFGELFSSQPAKQPRPRQAAPSVSDEEMFRDKPRLAFDRGEVSVRENAGEVRLMVRRTIAFGQPVQVRYVTEPGGERPAVAGKHFEAVDATLEFGPDERERTISVRIVDDHVVEGDRTFVVRLVAGKDAEVAAGHAVVTVIEDDVFDPARLACDAQVGFPRTAIGSEAQARLNCRNDGGEPATLASVTVATAGFAIGDDGCGGRALGPGQVCSTVLAFRPAGAGAATGKAIVQWQAKASSQLVEVALMGNGFDPEPPPDPMKERIARLQANRVKASQGGVTDSTEPLPTEPGANDYKLSEEDYSKIGLRRSYFTFPVKRERIITTDRYIRCVLETAINSQLAGGVICVVEMHVYGADGRRLLIPAGTRVEGDYKPLGRTGDTRLNVEWRRFIRPDGSSIYVSSGFQSLDAIGRVGLPGDVDNRWEEKYSTALFLTALSAGFAYATPTTDDRAATAQQTASEGIGTVAKQHLEENLDLRPITEVAAGTRLIIRPLTDLWFPVPELMAPVAAASSGPAAAAGSSGAVSAAQGAQNSGPAPSRQKATPR